MELKSKHMATCEVSRHTNLYVALVLHSPGEVSTEVGKPRAVVCDVWRYFTNAKPHAIIHQTVVQEICKHYKRLNPHLERAEFETDGCSSQFKGA